MHACMVCRYHDKKQFDVHAGISVLIIKFVKDWVKDFQDKGVGHPLSVLLIIIRFADKN